MKLAFLLILALVVAGTLPAIARHHHHHSIHGKREIHIPLPRPRPGFDAYDVVKLNRHLTIIVFGEAPWLHRVVSEAKAEGWR